MKNTKSTCSSRTSHINHTFTKETTWYYLFVIFIVHWYHCGTTIPQTKNILNIINRYSYWIPSFQNQKISHLRVMCQCPPLEDEMIFTNNTPKMGIKLVYSILGSNSTIYIQTLTEIIFNHKLRPP